MVQDSKMSTQTAPKGPAQSCHDLCLLGKEDREDPADRSEVCDLPSECPTVSVACPQSVEQRGSGSQVDVPP